MSNHADRIRGIVNAFLDENPKATFEQVCKRLQGMGFVVADKEMLREFLGWRGK
jgi:hypothetical protein